MRFYEFWIMHLLLILCWVTSSDCCGSLSLREAFLYGFENFWWVNLCWRRGSSNPGLKTGQQKGRVVVFSILIELISFQPGFFAVSRLSVPSAVSSLACSAVCPASLIYVAYLLLWLTSCFRMFPWSPYLPELWVTFWLATDRGDLVLGRF